MDGPTMPTEAEISQAFAATEPPPAERGLVGETVAGFKRGGLQLIDMAGNIARAVDPEGGNDVVRNAGFGVSRFAKERAAPPDVAESSYAENHPILGNIPKAAEMVIPSVGVPLALGAGSAALGLSAPVAAGVGIVGAGTAFGVSQFQDTKERGLEKGLTNEEATTAGVKTGLSEGVLEAASNIIPAAKLFKLGKPVVGSVVKSMFKAPTFKAGVKGLINDAAHIMTGEVSTEMAQAYTQGLTEKNAGIRPDADPWQEAKDVIGPTIALSLMIGGAVGGVNKLSRVATQRVLQNPHVGEDVRQQAADHVYNSLLAQEESGAVPAGSAENWKSNTDAAIKNKTPLVLSDELLAPAKPKLEVTEDEAAANILNKLADGVSPSDAIDEHNAEVAGVKNELDDQHLAEQLNLEPVTPEPVTPEPVTPEPVTPAVDTTTGEILDENPVKAWLDTLDAKTQNKLLKRATDLGSEKGQAFLSKKYLEANPEPAVTQPAAEPVAPVATPTMTTMGGITAELTPEQATEWSRIDAEHESRKAMYERQIGTGLDPQMAAKKIKGSAMQAAAEKRQAAPQFRTAKEVKAAKLREESNYQGKEVSYNSEPATVIGGGFGKVKLRLADGTEKSVPKEEVGARVVKTEKAKEVEPATPERVAENATPGGKPVKVAENEVVALNADNDKAVWAWTSQTGEVFKTYADVNADGTVDIFSPGIEDVDRISAATAFRAAGLNVVDSKGMPYAFGGDVKFAAKGVEDDATTKARIVREAQKAGKTLDPAKLSFVQNEESAKLDAVGRIFGKGVRVFSYDSKGATGDARIPHGFVIDSDSTIYVNSGSKNLHMVVVGHELTHKLVEEALPLFHELVGYLKINDSEYAKYAVEMRKFPEYAKMTNDQLSVEIVGNLVGTQFNKASFWDHMAAKEPTLFVKVLSWVKDFVAKLSGSLGTFGASEKIVQDIAQTEKVIAGVFAKYARRYQEGKFSESLDGGMKFAASEEAKPWYSKLESLFTERLKSVNPEKSLPRSHFEMILKDKGLKADEIKASGIEEFLKSKERFTAQEVQDDLKANAVDLKDVVLGEKKGRDYSITPNQEETEYAGHPMVDVVDPATGYTRFTGQPHEAQEWVNADHEVTGETNPTHFSQYTEPGAVEGSYREMFVTAPSEKGSTPSAWNIVRHNGEVVTSYISKERAEKAAATGEYTVEPVYDRGKGWQDGHSQYNEIQNPIVRIRFNERETAQGRTMFVEEMQGPSDANQQKMPEYLRKRIYDIGVKRVLAYAKENGFDGVAWTTGEMQAKRYDLSKQVDNIRWYKASDGRGYMISADKNGENLTSHETTKDNLADVVGKDLANKILNSPETSGEFSGLDLKVGGEGLKSLYDKTLPALFKKYGGEGVGETSIGTTTARPVLYPGFGTREKALAYIGGKEAENMVVRLNRETGNYDVIDPTAVDSAISTPFIPITAATPSSFIKFAAALDTPQAVNSWFKSTGRNLAQDITDKVMRFLMPTDRTITMAASQAAYAPIRKLLLQYKGQRQGKAGDIQAAMGDAQHVVKLINKAFKDTKSLSDLVFKATEYQLHADGAASGWTHETWEKSGHTDKTLAQAQAELSQMYSKFTTEQKVAHGAMLNQLQKVYLKGREAALAPWLQAHGKELFAQAEAYNKAVEESFDAQKPVADPGDEVKSLAATIKMINDRYPLLKGDYMPLMRFGDYVVRTVTRDANGELGGRTRTEFFDTQQEAIAYTDRINNNPDNGLHAVLETTKSLGDRNVVNIPAVMIDKLKAAAEARGVDGEALTQLIQDAEALRINMMPRTSTSGHKLHREGVEGYSTNVLKVFASYVRNHANANAGLIHGTKIEQTFRDMGNEIKAYTSETGYDPKAAIDMDRLYKHLYENERTSSRDKINGFVQGLGKASFLWYLSSPSIWAVQWSQPFMVTIPKMAAKYGYRPAFKAYTMAAKQYLHGDFSDEKIDTFNRDNNFVGDTIFDLITRSREEVGAEKKGTERQIKTLFDQYGTKEKRLVVLKVLSLQGRIDLSASHSLQDLAAATNAGDQFVDRISQGGQKVMDKAGFFMQHSETGSRRAAAIASFEMALEKEGFVGANDYAADIINDTLFDFDSANRGKAWQGNTGHVLGQFQFFRMHMLGKMLQLVKDSWKGQTPEQQRESRKELAYMTGTSFALAGAGGTPIALAFGNTVSAALWSALSFLFGDDDDPWDAQRDFELAVKEGLGDTLGNVVLKGLPSIVGMDISQRIGLGGMGDVVMGDPPAGVSGTAKANWYAGRILGPAWGMVSDTIRAMDYLAEGDLVKATQYSSPKVLRDFLKTYEMGDHGVQGGGKTILKGEDVNPYSYALMMLGINPLEVSLASEESRYLKNISTHLSQRRSGLIKDLAKATADSDLEAKEAAILAINTWSGKNPSLKITAQELASGVKKEMRTRAGVLTKREQIVKETYGGEK